MVRAVTSPSLTGRNLISGVLLGLVASALVLACSSSSDDTSGAADAGVDRRLPGPIHPAASCYVTIETPELVPGTHVPEGTVITYNSNPPSSGPHYPVWANFQEYAAPLDEGYLVHSLEHGAVALLYKCDPATDACKPTIEALRKIRDSLATDPMCDPSIRVRVVIARSSACGCSLKPVRSSLVTMTGLPPCRAAMSG